MSICESDEEPDKEAQKNVLESRINHHLAQLSDTEQEVVRQIYLNDETITGLSRKSGISKYDLGKILKKSLKKLRATMSRDPRVLDNLPD